MNRNKMIGFWEDTAPTLCDDEFRRYFRMNKETLKSLFMFLKPKRRAYQGGREQISGKKAVAMTVAFLGCQLPFKQLSGFFGVSERCLIQATHYIMGMLCAKSSSVIKWPDKEDYPRIAAAFNNKRIRYNEQNKKYLKNSFQFYSNNNMF